MAHLRMSESLASMVSGSGRPGAAPCRPGARRGVPHAAEVLRPRHLGSHRGCKAPPKQAKQVPARGGGTGGGAVGAAETAAIPRRAHEVLFYFKVSKYFQSQYPPQKSI